MKVIGGIHADLMLEESDYFLVQLDGENLKIILTDSKRRPLNIRNVSRRQAYSLISQLQRAMMLQDAVRLEEATFSVEGSVDSLKEQGGADEQLLDQQED